MSGLALNRSTMTTATETTGKAAVITEGCSRIQDRSRVTLATTTNEIKISTTIIKKSGIYTRDQEIAMIVRQLKN